MPKAHHSHSPLRGAGYAPAAAHLTGATALSRAISGAAFSMPKKPP
ncbi:hypothetical protein [Sphingorhabdus sp.]